MSYYTSYETSVALREAGAPQLAPQHEPTVYVLNWGIYWNSDGKDKPWLGARVGDDFSVRAWRLDELIEALEKAGCVIEIEHAPPGDAWHVGVLLEDTRYCEDTTEDHAGCRWMLTPVEAAAACWLAVLRAAREVAR